MLLPRIGVAVAIMHAAAIAVPAQTTLVPAGATWRYLDDGTNQGSAWQQPSFDDSGWAAGPAPLGYGEGDEATTVGFGPDPNRKYITTYFRHAFHVSEPGTIQELCLRLIRDDGAIVYLNGTEIGRSNLTPAALLSYLDLAVSATGAAQETVPYSFAVDPALLQAGTNVLAVEVHQHAASSDDLRMDVRLVASTGMPCAAQPNILVLVADDLGVDSVDVYQEGPRPPPTPNIDALAAQGLLFRNAWASPVCSPSRACFHTGRYPFRTYVGQAIPLSNTGVLQLSEMTLPEVLDLGAGNYTHALIGKWHLGDARNGGPLGPNLAGWSHFAGLIPGALMSYYSWPRTVDGVTTTATTYATTQMVDDALAWIGQQNGPWVCYLTFNAAHGPYQEPPPHLHSQNLAGLNPQVEPVPFFKAIVEAMDNEIGRLLASLGPERSRTNVIFFGDNGTDGPVSQPPFLASHAKATAYEGGLNVPLIVAGPAVASPGREEGALVHLVDLFATVTELAGVDARAVVPSSIALDSVSLVPYFADPAQPPLRQMVFSEMFSGDSWATVNSTGFAAARNDRYKLIRFFNGASQTEELYDLVRQQFENANLLGGTLNPMEAANYQALQMEIDRLRTPPGLLPVFGESNCLGSNGAPALTAAGTPTLGADYQLQLTNAPATSIVGVFVGQSATELGQIVLPFPLELIGGGPGCYVYTTNDMVLPTVSDATGSAAVTIPVPFEPALVGGRVFHSWIVVDQAAPNNDLGLTLSNAAAATVGV
ncbi:MAG: sulfatase-like hydrolase/transferase [Planctomycetota bacterium]